jgi:hypothetical protein
MPTAPARSLASVVARHRWLRFVIDHNPCYLLSAACMLLGCYLLNAALYTPAGDVRKLLVVLAVANVYEACVILLARVLIRFPLVRRDAWIVLFVESLFLTDITFASGVISTVDPWWGLAINGGLLALAAVKVYVILRLLRVQRVARAWAFILFQIATLLAIPIVFKQLSLPNHGRVSPVAVYLTWWVAGLLPVLGTMLWTLPPSRRRAEHPQSRANDVLCGLYVAVPFVSLLVHLYSAAWVYEVPFAPAFVAPVLIGIAVGARLAEALVQRYWVERTQFVLLAAAVCLSMGFPDTLLFRVGPCSPNFVLVVSPLRVALGVVALFSLYMCWRQHRLACLLVSGACIAAAVLGHSVSAIRVGMEQLGQMTLTLAWRSVPRTTLQWGCTAMAGAFTLLGLGAFLSRHKLKLPTGADGSTIDATGAQ